MEVVEVAHEVASSTNGAKCSCDFLRRRHNEQAPTNSRTRLTGNRFKDLRATTTWCPSHRPLHCTHHVTDSQPAAVNTIQKALTLW